MEKNYGIKNDPFYRQIFKLVLPIVIQNLLSAAVSSADVVMLNYVGQSSISAVSLAAQYANVLFMVFYGLGTGATMLCAQYYGKGDMRAIQAVEGIALRFSLCFSLAFAAARSGRHDAHLHQRRGTDFHRRVLSAMDERQLSVLGHYGSVPGCPAQHRPGHDQHSHEYTRFFNKYYFKCSIYIWF